MSLPGGMWPGRVSPYTPVGVPLTGALTGPAPQPPAAATGAAAGAVANGFVVVARFVAGSVDVGPVVVAGGFVARGVGAVVVAGCVARGLGARGVGAVVVAGS